MGNLLNDTWDITLEPWSSDMLEGVKGGEYIETLVRNKALAAEL